MKASGRRSSSVSLLALNALVAHPCPLGMAHNVIVIRYVIYIHNAYTRYTYVSEICYKGGKRYAVEGAGVVDAFEAVLENVQLVFWPGYCANNVAAPKSLYWRILSVYVMRVIR